MTGDESTVSRRASVSSSPGDGRQVVDVTIQSHPGASAGLSRDGAGPPRNPPPVIPVAAACQRPRPRRQQRIPLPVQAKSNEGQSNIRAFFAPRKQGIHSQEGTKIGCNLPPKATRHRGARPGAPTLL